MAKDFSPSRMEVEGEPFLAVADGSGPSVAADGTLLYRPSRSSSLRQLAWFDRAGQVLAKIGDPVVAPMGLRLSPDGSRLAFTAEAELNNRELFVMGLPNGVPTRLTFTPDRDEDVEWAASGQRLFFSSFTNASATRPVLYTKAADGTGEMEKLTDGEQPAASADGKRLVYLEGDGLWHLGLDGDPKPEPLEVVAGKELGQPALSPGGRFLAYTSTEAGGSQVFPRPYPDANARWQLTKDRGFTPRWNRRGDRLYSVDFSRALWEIELQTSPAVSWQAPRKLFTLPGSYDIALDGRIVSHAPVEAASGPAPTPSIVVTQNWFSEFEGKKKAR